MTQVIILKDQDGMDIALTALLLETEDNTTDMRASVKSACEEYLSTPEGRETYEHNCRNFNWGDFILYVPNEICRKHGFTKIDTFTQDGEIDYNEQLAKIPDE